MSNSLSRSGRPAALAIALLLSAACAGPRSGARSVGNTDRALLTRTEIAKRSFDNMYSVVSSLRSDWLRPPLGGTGFGERSATAQPTIFVDGRLVGALELLRSFSAESVERAYYYTATEAQNKFGTAVASPVIELVTRGRSGGRSGPNRGAEAVPGNGMIHLN